jgi:hypothetical protein
MKVSRVERAKWEKKVCFDEWIEESVEMKQDFER